MLNSIISRYRAWKRREATRRELLHLTDRELQDMASADRISIGSSRQGTMTASRAFCA